MISATPLPFKEALAAHGIKSLLPTTGRTRDLSQLESAIKQRALFSALVTSAQHLGAIRDGVTAVLAGELDQATVRLGLKNLLKASGYQPDPEQAGGLQDLSSTRRINLQIETNVATARGAGWFEQGQQADVLDEWPAQELYRVTTPEGGAKAERDWAQRWIEAGGKFYGDGMIARKDDPVWSKLGDPTLFPDGLGNEWPPFAFNSGMRVRDVDRATAVSLGLIDPSEELFPRPADLTADLAASPVLRESWLQQAITDSGLGTFQNGVLNFKPVG